MLRRCSIADNLVHDFRSLVGVEEEELLVGGQGPEVSRNLSFQTVAHVAGCLHGLQPQHARELGFFQWGRSAVHAAQAGFHGRNGAGHVLAVHACSLG